MRRRVGLAFWVESALASFTAFLGILTLVWRDWVEGVFGFDPDLRSGFFEWTIVAVCCLVTMLFSLLAWSGWRRAPLKAVSADSRGI